MNRVRASLLSAVILSMSASIAPAQSVISASSGTIHVAEGDVMLNNEPVKLKPGIFPSVRESQILRTEDGRSEVLLTPGSFLRLGEQTSIKMISTKLTDTVVEVLSGSAILECAELLKENKITIKAGDATMSPTKAGVYRIDVDQKRVRVYNGDLAVLANGKQEHLKEHKQMSLDGAYAIASFDKDDLDPLDRWSGRRDAFVAKANMNSAQSGYLSGYGYSPVGLRGGWMYDPLFGMFSFYPYGGYLNSPYGYAYYTPQTFAYYYNPPTRSRYGNSANSSNGGWANQGSSGFQNQATSYSNSRSDAFSSNTSSVSGARGAVGGGSIVSGGTGGGGISSGGARSGGGGMSGGGAPGRH